MDRRGLRGAGCVHARLQPGARPRAGLQLLDRLENDPRINTDRRFHAVRAHLLEKNGDRQAALDAYQEAARRATNLQQQRYLNLQVARLQGGD